MVTDPFQRFLVVKQSHPTQYIISISSDGYKPHIAPLCWELIDRGEDFVAYKPETLDEKVLSSFATEEEARHLREVLLKVSGCL